jgi:transcriptional regulator with XRE-family HTH domain
VTAESKAQAICSVAIRLLREERERRGLSKYVIAGRSGLSQQMVGYVERGIRNPTLETAVRMADAIGVDLADILKQARATASKQKSK